MKNRIKDFDIKNKYKILENQNTYKKFLRFIQNDIEPEISQKNC